MELALSKTMIGDIILVERVRMPEYMLVTGFEKIICSYRSSVDIVAPPLPIGSVAHV